MKLLVIVAALLLSACTTTFTNMTPTKALDPLDVELSAHMQASAHGSIIRKTIDGGDEARDIILDDTSTDDISEEQLRDFLDAGLAWFMFKPGVSTELSARIGGPELLEGMDFGLRYDFTTIKADWKLQIFESQDESFALSSIIGIGKQTVPVPGAIEWLTLTEWKRMDFDFMLSAGFELPDIVKAYVNPRLMLSRISVGHKLPSFVLDRIPQELLDRFDPNAKFNNELMVYYGATTGVMVGYKYVFLALELTVMKLDFEPTVLGQKRDFDSLLVAPAFGLVVTW